jgi:hypothetical protein
MKVSSQFFYLEFCLLSLDGEGSVLPDHYLLWLGLKVSQRESQSPELCLYPTCCRLCLCHLGSPWVSRTQHSVPSTKCKGRKMWSGLTQPAPHPRMEQGQSSSHHPYCPFSFTEWRRRRDSGIRPHRMKAPRDKPSTSHIERGWIGE